MGINKKEKERNKEKNDNDFNVIFIISLAFEQWEN